MTIEDVEVFLAKNRAESKKHREENLERDRRTYARAMTYWINT